MDRERFSHPKRGGRGIGRGRVVTRVFPGRGRGGEEGGYGSSHDRGGEEGGYGSSHDRGGEEGGYGSSHDRGGEGRGYGRSHDRGGEGRGYGRSHDRGGEGRGYGRRNDRGGEGRGYGSSHDRGGEGRGYGRSHDRGGEEGGYGRSHDRGGEGRGYGRSHDRGGEGRGYGRSHDRGGEGRGYGSSHDRGGEGRGYGRRYDRGGEEGGYGRRYDRGGEGRGYGRRYDRGGEEGGYGSSHDRGGEGRGYGRRYDRGGEGRGYGRRYDRGGEEGGYGSSHDRGGEGRGYGRRYDRGGEEGGYGSSHDRGAEEGGYGRRYDRGGEEGGYGSSHDRGARSMESLAELNGCRQMPGAQDGCRQMPGAQDGSRPKFGDQARRKPNFAPRDGKRRNQEIHNDPAKEEHHATGFKKQRKYPISGKDLDRLTTLQPDLVVLELLSEKSGFSLLVEQNDITPPKYDLAIKVLARATTCQSIRESVYELLNKTLTEGFAAKLIIYSLTVKRQYPEKGRVFFADLHTVMETFCNGMMSIAINRLINLVDTCHSAVTTLEAEGQVEDCMVKKYKILLDRLTEAAKKWEPEKKIDEQDSRKRRVAEMDNMEPPDDFRELSVLPTPMDIVDTKRPFLRRNVLQGRYTDGQHYLDVQFRLLREDFVRPLREGICKFRSNAKSRIMDVRIYRNVTYIGSQLQHHRIFHEVKLESMKLENSKRLMYGNLVCFSNDNFATMILGSVADKSPEALKKSIIGIEFESDISEFDMSGNFTMVESRAYFMAYKHVLQALKDMPNNIPMEMYVVHVEGFVHLPRYLGVEHFYDLRVIRSKTMMKKSEALNRFFKEELAEAQEEVAQDVRHLENVQIARGLAEWPSADDLGLDSSQHRALHSALTRELAIIQGPPGTGKTFLGLKIVQTLLHNSQVWKTGENPILVVCFTNHALDQFLEGMTTFTNSIVRVGSRTKSETIEKYQINKLVQGVVSSRSMPHCIHSQKSNITSELRHLENGIGMCRQVDIECGAARGIFSLNVFAASNIIPQHILQQLQQAPSVDKLMYWLALSYQSQNASRLSHQVDESTAKKQKASQQQTDAKLGHEIDEDEFRDAVELLEIEERDRMIEDDFEEPNWKTDLAKINQVTFEVTKEKLEHELANLDAILQEEENDAASLQFITSEGHLTALNHGLKIPVNRQEMEALETQATLNIWRLDPPRKWQLYNHWVAKLQRHARPQCKSLSALLQKRTKALEGVKNAEYLLAMRRAAVVGMTTTGAAQYNKILQDLAPAIVVIEEAAEILESHVITSLTAGCQHLIMIGDHQQLQPSATVYELAKKYGLETSLFERLIKNGLAFETLEYQHRMRPSISSLLVPSIYPTLKNHPSVHEYPPVLGIVTNIFFIAHQELERKESDDNNSHENQHEAEFMMGLCRHLVLQGYSPDDITILTAYSGQLFLLKKLQRQEHICTGVKICVVDNYQGEENKIILLSLVRSNPEGSVGFLRTDNRVCVALSRAKHGLYITGNMELLSQSSDLWKNINADLHKSGSVGKALPLRCQNHVHIVSMVSTGQDFLAKSPEGGCVQVCAKPLPQCRHCCPKVCHMNDLEHVQYKCQVQCPKSVCSLDHKCPKLCWEDCGPCMVILAKDLPCSHVHSIACHVEPRSYKCPTKVVKVIPACHHEVTMPCCQDASLFPCPEDCDTRLDCGHKCKKKCHRTKDPDHQEYSCMDQCTRINVGCSQNHPCLKRCYQECGSCVVLVNKELPCGHEAKDVECAGPVEEIKCQKKCKKTLPCGHACKKLCYKECGACMVPTKKAVPTCNHTVTVCCSQPATTDRCEGLCPKTLSCGHPCKAKCKEKCTTECLEIVATTNKCPKGHAIRLPCHLRTKVQGAAAWDYCRERCDKSLECEHRCAGTCGRCLHGRLHQACSQPCERSLVCGHVCKYPCGVSCPPCQEQCQWKCGHSQCRQKCGMPCQPCKEKCDWKCRHTKCTNRCGDKCSRKPCDEPCSKKLKCDHECVGFCGDPCPPLCRECDAAELTDFMLLGNEDEPDARFVYLEDCGHCIEVEGLEGWLMQDGGEVGMKTCPKCRSAIYNNRRYQHLVLEAYEAVTAIKRKYYKAHNAIKEKDIELILQDPELIESFHSRVMIILKKMGTLQGKRRKTFQRFSVEEKAVCHFQAQVLKKATSILNQLKDTPLTQPDAKVGQGQNSQLKHLADLTPKVAALVGQVMEKTTSISRQMEVEVTCELQRLMVLPSYWTFLEKFTVHGNSEMVKIKAKLEALMNPTIRFDEELDKKVRALLKESEQYIGGLGVSDSERVMILKAMQIRQGHWYKCPNGHVYCITECGGAMVESNCPECGSRIGGGSHRLREDNALASEMDGATHAAWSENNNMANFDINDL